MRPAVGECGVGRAQLNVPWMSSGLAMDAGVLASSRAISAGEIAPGNCTVVKGGVRLVILDRARV